MINSNEYINDISFMEGYYDALCEAVEVTIKTKDKEKKEKSKEALERYKKYKEKRLAQGKDALDLDEWLEEQERARHLKYEAAKAGIKVVGAVAATATLSKCVKNNTIEIETKNGNKIKLGRQVSKQPKTNKRHK